MDLLKKIFSLFVSRKIKMLKQLRKGDKINIYAPKGYYVTINGKKFDEQVISINIHNNDPKSKRIWFYQKVDDEQVSFIKSYNSEIFKDFILLNYKPETFKPQKAKAKSKAKSKKDLESQMKEAVSQENFELANLLNEEIKKLNNATN